jgi:hypothetical protein
VELGSDPGIAAALIVAVAEHAGVAAELVARPLFGVALALPEHANTLEVARALDAEQVTAGYLDLEGRACIALPANAAHVEQTAHAVAKVLHLLLEIHTGFINEQSDACPLPDMSSLDAETTATALLDAISTFGAALADWRRVRDAPDELHRIVVEGMMLVWEMLHEDHDRE